MNISPGQAQKTLTRIFDEQMLLVEAAIHEIAFLILEALVVGNQFGNATGTPVQTGFARGSWRVILARAPTEIDAGPADPSGAGVLAREGAKLATAPLGVPITFANGAEYFVYLEYGRSVFTVDGVAAQGPGGAFHGPWSPQAPNGVVRLVVAHFPDLVKSVVEKYKGAGLRIAA